MSDTLYFGLWAVYSLASLIFIYFFWGFTRWPRLWWLGSFLRIMAIVVLATPAAQSDGSPFLTPAWITLVFDELQRLDGGWFRAGVNLMASVSIGLIIYFLYLVFSFLQRARRIKRS